MKKYLHKNIESIQKFWLDLYKSSTLIDYVILIIVLILGYRYISQLDFTAFLIFVISALIFSLLTTFVLDKFKYSKNRFVRFVQKFVIYNLLILLSILFLSYIGIDMIPKAKCDTDDEDDGSESENENSNEGSETKTSNEGSNTNDNTSKNTDEKILNVNTGKGADGTDVYKFEVKKDTLDKALNLATKVVNSGVEYAVPNIGAGAAAGAVGAAVVKATAGLPPMQRAGAIGGATFIGGLGAKLGIEGGATLARNTDVKSLIKNSPHSDTNVDRVPSPGPETFINSPLEEFEGPAPLLTLLLCLFSFNLLELLLFIILCVLLLYRYVLKYNIYIFSYLVNRFMPNKFKIWFEKFTHKGTEYNNRFFKLMLIILSILFLLIKLSNLYFTAELYFNIDSFVDVYNYLKNINKSSVLFLVLKTDNILTTKNKITTNYKLNVNKKFSFYSKQKRLFKFKNPFPSVENLIQPENIKNTFTTTSSGKNGVHYWKDFLLETPGGFLTNNLITFVTTNFFEKIIYPNFEIYRDISYCVILKLVFKDGSVRCISKLLVVTRKNNINELIDAFITFWLMRSEYYHLKEVKKIVISYRTYNINDISNLDIFRDKLSKVTKENENENEKTEYEYTGYSLPSTMDLSKWGELLKQKAGNSKLIAPIGRSKKNTLRYNVFTYEDHNDIQVFSNDRLILEFEDYYLKGENEKSTFKRVIKNVTIFYEKGKKNKEIISRQVKFIKPRSKDLYLTDKFITLDIETRNIDGCLFPICISIYDGKETKSFFIKDFNSEFEMVKVAFGYLNKRKYHYQKVYIHNLSKFDGVFLLKYLGMIGQVKTIMRNQCLYEIRLNFGKDNILQEPGQESSLASGKGKGYVVILRDSYLILTSSLSKLSKNFKISDPKSIFPIFAVNDLPLDYKGVIPHRKYFLSEKDYTDYILIHKGVNGEWDLKKELIKYCENDVIALHQVIDKFAFEIFDLFRIDIHKYLTLSSIAFGIYQSNFLKDSKIPKISGQMFKDIFQSYKGGLVDMFKPQGTNLFAYDVNSEYPDAMCLDMPAGYVKFLKGDLDLKDKDIFGFFKAEIIAPDELDLPVLPIKYKGNTLCTLGQWTDWYFSEELRDAVKYGYKIKLLYGYNFQRKNLFKEYVNTLYSIKEITPKDDSKYLIIKFLLNMLYGKFGMKPDKDLTIIVKKDESEKILMDPNNEIFEHFVFDNDTEFIRYSKKVPEEKIDHEFYYPNVSIAIASAVVAYGRIKINTLKHMNGINVYYSDTDSVFTDKPLPKELIGTKLGQLKLENIIKLGYFVAPKVYGFVNSNLDTKVKVKGLKAEISFYELNMILYKNTTITKNQEKWYRRWEEGKIYIRNEIYSLIVTDNKRQLIYDSYSKLVATKPYIYINGKIINKEIGFILNIKEPEYNK